MTEEAFYVEDGPGPDGADRFVSTEHTTSPWGRGVQHGGPPAALLGRALERLPAASDRVVARVTMDLWGPVPVGPVAVSARVERPGRSVELVSADLVAGDRLVARASAWRFPGTAATGGTAPTDKVADKVADRVADRVTDGAAQPRTPPVDVPRGPEHGHEQPRPPSWCGGYLDAVEWRWLRGAVLEPGPATVWMRPRVPLVRGEQMSPLQRLLTCADSASGASAALDPSRWAFMNTELSVHVVRPVVGAWVCVDAETTLAGTATGLAAARLLDPEGLVGRSAQALLVSRR